MLTFLILVFYRRAKILGNDDIVIELIINGIYELQNTVV